MQLILQKKVKKFQIPSNSGFYKYSQRPNLAFQYEMAEIIVFENRPPTNQSDSQLWTVHTDKQENKIFHIYKEIQNGAVAKSYMKKGFLIYEEMRKYLTIYEEAVSHTWFCTAPFWIS